MDGAEPLSGQEAPEAVKPQRSLPERVFRFLKRRNWRKAGLFPEELGRAGR